MTLLDEYQALPEHRPAQPFDPLRNFAEWCLGAPEEVGERMVRHIKDNARAVLAQLARPYPSPLAAEINALPEHGLSAMVERLQGDLTAAQQRYADGLEAWKANNAHFAARIAELREALRTYGWHKPECDYMQEELPCTCGFMDAIKGRDIGPLPGGDV